MQLKQQQQQHRPRQQLHASAMTTAPFSKPSPCLGSTSVIATSSSSSAALLLLPSRCGGGGGCLAWTCARNAVV